ncbi:hypothetical protein [Pseudomonas putida]|uniref:hypothetical protein n=1 Tax=Pseudomonas putida TaxID=303 RepID=UPI0039E02C20
MKEHDFATQFTLAYLELLEEHLKVTWNENRIPICVIDWITDESLLALREGLTQLMSSELEVAARKATAAYGVEHVQTVGFGLAPDFDQFVKLGLIYGERVVLWDVLHSRILGGADTLARKSLIGQIACELLMLREVVEQGGVVLLAHPVNWSADAAAIDQELKANGPVPAASLGLAMAFAAIQEGLQLHPYTLLTEASRQELAPAINAADSELFSSESFKFQQCLTTILQDERVAFVADVPARDFHSVVSKHESLQRKIRQHFQSALTGLSPQQMRQENAALVGELFELFGKRDADLKAYVADASDASLAFVFGSLSATVIGQPLITALATLGPPALALAAAVRKWRKKPEKNVIIQAFKSLEKSASETCLHDPVDVQARLSTVKKGIDTLGGHYQEFMSLRWTEDKHDYLTTVSPEIAKAILALLTPDDVDRIVNDRRFQADYIGDYLEYISDLDETIYWVHLQKTFESEDGFLLYDGDAHITAMEERQIPMSLWSLLIDKLFTIDYDLTDVIYYQTERVADRDEKRITLLAIASGMDEDDKASLAELVGRGNEGEIPEWFRVGHNQEEPQLMS